VTTEPSSAPRTPRESDETKPGLLFLCHSLPYPPDGGQALRSYNILKLLAEDFDVRALFFYRRAIRRTGEDVARGLSALSPVARASAYPIPGDTNPLRMAVDHLRSVATGRVYTRFVHTSSAFRRALLRALEDDPPRLVHVDSLDLSAYLPDVRHLPFVITHHNVESRLLDRRARASRSRVASSYLRLQARLMEREEASWGACASLNVVVSEGERDALGRLVPPERIAVVPNGVDTRRFRPSTRASRQGLVFVGAYSWLPNRDAMEYLGREILPLIRARTGNVPVTWVGQAPERAKRTFARRYGIRLTGYVESIDPWVHSAACYVVPLRIGGGTRLKILDAWALGSAVVSTTVGCEGLAGRDREDIWIADGPAAFADAVVRVLEDPSLGERLATGGRRTAVTRFDWRVIGRTMLPRYHALLSGAGRDARAGGAVL